MMILLGQHGQRQDYQTGLDYIQLAAQSCDENAPQGAYVRDILPLNSANILHDLTWPFAGLWHASRTRAAPSERSREFSSP
jgi:hypothetical protein